MTEERLKKIEKAFDLMYPTLGSDGDECINEIRRCWTEIEELKARLARMRAAGAAIAELQGQEAEE